MSETKRPKTIEEFNQRYGAKTVTWKQLMAAMDKVGTGTVDVIKRVLDGPRVDGRFAALESRLAALEAKPHVKFCGIYTEGQTYEPGDAVTRSGGLWICKAQTTGTPGVDFVGWQLAVKKGSA